MNTERLKKLKTRLVQASMGASALRGSTTGTLDAARDFLDTINLVEFCEKAKTSFDKAHADLVSSLSTHLEGNSLSNEFGRCAKAVNLFLRAMAENHHIRQAYDLEGLEQQLHLPIDSHAYAGLKQYLTSENAFPWKGIINLKNIEYENLQSLVRIEATRRNIPPIELDNFFWRSERLRNRNHYIN